MHEPDLRDDEELVREVGQVLAIPETVRAYARAVFGLRQLEGELAALSTDSWTDPQPVGMRDNGPTSRVLVFSASQMSVEIRLPGDGTMLGQLIPPESRQIEVHSASGVAEVRTDSTGLFATRTPAESGLIVVVVVTESGRVKAVFDPRRSR